MDTTLSRLQAGQLLDGRYRVGSWIARGGMATVYLGTDTKLDRTVALKIAHAELAHDPDFVRRFTSEALSVARLSSPNVVGVYDQGSHAGLPYLVMEYVPGQTLRELMRARGRLEPREALDIISGVLTGLAAAHEGGIVHRDVKPENVLLGAGNVIKVADFGLARAASRASHTQTGMLIGTAAYLAPEQVARSVSDSRTDVYAAGVMLFEMLTGVQPHTGETPLAVAHKHVSDVVPPPSSVVPGLPPSLDALVALATNRDPDLRPGDAGQFLQAISDARSGLPVAGPAGPPQGQLLPAPPLRVSGPVPSVDPAGFPWFDEDNAPAGRHDQRVVRVRRGGRNGAVRVARHRAEPPAHLPFPPHWLAVAGGGVVLVEPREPGRIHRRHGTADPRRRGRQQLTVRRAGGPGDRQPAAGIRNRLQELAGVAGP